MPELDEFAVREWFKTVGIEQARDTFRVVEGILEMRLELLALIQAREDIATDPALTPQEAEAALKAVDQQIAEYLPQALANRSVPKRARRKDAGTKRGQDPQIALADAGLRENFRLEIK